MRTTIAMAHSTFPTILLTSGEVLRLVGLSQRELAYWDQSALVRPHGRSADGPGSRRLYTLLDVIQLKIIKRLRDAGVSLQRVRNAFSFLSDLVDEPSPLAELEILTDGNRIFVRRSDEAVVDALARQYALRFPVSDLLAEVHRDLRLVPASAGNRLGELPPIGGGPG